MFKATERCLISYGGMSTGPVRWAKERSPTAPKTDNVGTGLQTFAGFVGATRWVADRRLSQPISNSTRQATASAESQFYDRAVERHKNTVV